MVGTAAKLESTRPIGRGSSSPVLLGRRAEPRDARTSDLSREAKAADWVCVHVCMRSECVCVCVRETERERERVCVCV